MRGAGAPSRAVLPWAALLVAALAGLPLAQASPLPPCAPRDAPRKEGPDCFALLDVPRGASPRDVKRAYRQKAREVHPDKVSGAEEKAAAERAFVLLATAHEVLSDDALRAEYERWGRGWLYRGEGGGDDIFAHDAAWARSQYEAAQDPLSKWWGWALLGGVAAAGSGAYAWMQQARRAAERRAAQAKRKAGMLSAVARERGAGQRRAAEDAHARAERSTQREKRFRKALESALRDAAAAVRALAVPEVDESAGARLRCVSKRATAATACAAASLEAGEADAGEVLAALLGDISRAASESSWEAAVGGRANERMRQEALRWRVEAASAAASYDGDGDERQRGGQLVAMAHVLSRFPPLLRELSATAMASLPDEGSEASTAVSESAGVGDDWDEEQLSALRAALRKHPAGAPGRFEKIAAAVGRPTEEVVRIVKAHPEVVSASVGSDAYSTFLAKRQKGKGGDAEVAKSTNKPAWTEAATASLVKAIRAFPAAEYDTAERWARIAAAIPGEHATPKECRRKAVELASALSKRKAAAK